MEDNEDQFALESDFSNDEEGDDEEAEENQALEIILSDKKREEESESDHDPLPFGIEERIRQARPLEEESSNEDITENNEDSEEEPELDLQGAYNSDDYRNLKVSSEIKELFEYIDDYKPVHMGLETRFKPFIQDYIPAVGDIDAFLKVARPDGKEETLGKLVLDEPIAQQSDPTVLELQLRALSKQSTKKEAIVRGIPANSQKEKAIEKWINDISDLHQSKPPPTVFYSKPMPEIDALMQEWPTNVEASFAENGILTADFECDIGTFVDLACALCDIPVYKSRIQSLHLLFTLYSTFKNSPHFGARME